MIGSFDLRSGRKYGSLVCLLVVVLLVLLVVPLVLLVLLVLLLLLFLHLLISFIFKKTLNSTKKVVFEDN